MPYCDHVQKSQPFAASMLGERMWCRRYQRCSAKRTTPWRPSLARIAPRAVPGCAATSGRCSNTVPRPPFSPGVRPSFEIRSGSTLADPHPAFVGEGLASGLRS
jgi:hypothetical protein